MPKTTFFFGARNTKGVIDPWDVDSDIGWQSIAGRGTKRGIDMYFQRVPWFHRGVKDRSDNVSHMPWTILNGKKEIATSKTWSDDKPPDLEFLGNPRRLLSQLEQSICVAGKAYIALSVNRSGYIKKFAYQAPQTILEVYDRYTGELTGFQRAVGGRLIDCDLATSPVINANRVRIVAIYDPDYMTESGPGETSDGMAALNAAGANFNKDKFIGDYFGRGAVKASIMSIETGGVDEQRRLQKFWDDVISGIKNAWAGLVFRGKINTPIVIGEGLESLSNINLTKELRQEIATALGIPESRLWSAAANMATRGEDEIAYFRGKIIPECDLIAEAFNDQVFTVEHKLDTWQWKFNPEELDIFQEDEAARAGSLRNLVTAGLPLDIALDELGYNLDQKDMDRIKVMVLAKEQAALNAAQAPAAGALPPGQATNQGGQLTADGGLSGGGGVPGGGGMVDPRFANQKPRNPTGGGGGDASQFPAAAVKPKVSYGSLVGLVLTADQRKELDIWQRKSIKGLLESGRADVEFEVRTLGADVAGKITAGLPDCGTVEDVKDLFTQATLIEPETYKLFGRDVYEVEAHLDQADPWLMTAERLAAAIEESNQVKDFNPDEPRDSRGRWTSGGGSGPAGNRGKPGGQFQETGTIPRSRAEMLRQLAKKQGGYTYHPTDDSIPTDGLVLSIYPDNEQTLKMSELTPHVIREYIRKNRPLLNDPGNYAGAWYDSEHNLVFLDISKIVKTHEEALALSIKYKQEAYWDLGKMEEVRVGAHEPILPGKKSAGGKKRAGFTLINPDATDAQLQAIVDKLKAAFVADGGDLETPTEDAQPGDQAEDQAE